MKRSHLAMAGLVAACTVLGACSAGPPRPPREYIDRVLQGAVGEAQPSVIVAKEIAFARAAREEGQWTAFNEYAADDAVLHGQNGPIPAKQWLAGQSNPPAAVQWAPRSIWMSCDGSIAVSQGRFRDPDGTVGTFVTVWERQSDRDYRYVYDGGAPDDPQPPAPAPDAPAGKDDIVVTAIDAVQGLVAECPTRGEALPLAPDYVPAAGIAHGGGVSRDGTLRWRWEHGGEAGRRVAAEYLVDGEWQVALDQPLPLAKD